MQVKLCVMCYKLYNEVVDAVSAAVCILCSVDSVLLHVSTEPTDRQVTVCVHVACGGLIVSRAE